MLSKYTSIFLSSRCYFLTLRHPDEKKGINFVDKLVNKVSKTYIIVRERNKTQEGFHFHAIMKMSSLPKKNWFIKKVHMNIKPIGNHVPTVPSLFTDSDINDAQATDGGEEWVEHMIENQADRRFQRVLLKPTSQNDTHVRRVLCYMSKDLDMPIQYVDYIYCRRGKRQKISDG